MCGIFEAWFEIKFTRFVIIDGYEGCEERVVVTQYADENFFGIRDDYNYSIYIQIR